jgi:hypothetical protein
MNDSVILTVALVVGLLGLLLLFLGGAAALLLGAGTQRAKETSSASKSQSRGKRAASVRESQPPAPVPAAEHAGVGGMVAWMKAWVFAIVHAATVSFVLGGITFFEDLVRASLEIRRTGTVTFPKQLLPGTLSGSPFRLLTHPSDADSDEDEEWVVGVLDETEGVERR